MMPLTMMPLRKFHRKELWLDRFDEQRSLHLDCKELHFRAPAHLFTEPAPHGSWGGRHTTSDAPQPATSFGPAYRNPW